MNPEKKDESIDYIVIDGVKIQNDDPKIALERLRERLRSARETYQGLDHNRYRPRAHPTYPVNPLLL